MEKAEIMARVHRHNQKWTAEVTSDGDFCAVRDETGAYLSDGPAIRALSQAGVSVPVNSLADARVVARGKLGATGGVFENEDGTKVVGRIVLPSAGRVRAVSLLHGLEVMGSGPTWKAAFAPIGIPVD